LKDSINGRIKNLEDDAAPLADDLILKKLKAISARAEMETAIFDKFIKEIAVPMFGPDPGGHDETHLEWFDKIWPAWLAWKREHEGEKIHVKRYINKKNKIYKEALTLCGKCPKGGPEKTAKRGAWWWKLIQTVNELKTEARSI